MFFVFLSMVTSKVNHLPIIPYPVDVKIQDGQWELQSTDTIYYDSSIEGASDVAATCAKFLRQVTGFSLPVVTTKTDSGISFEKSADSSLGAEGYDLVSSASAKLVISATSRKGLFYGYQTLLQILPIDVFTTDHVVYTHWIAPACTIHDYPRFQWRGFMVDPSRRFTTLTALRSIIDGMAVNKMNVLHIHLVDDQGWRIEVKKYPKLVEIGSFRKASPVMWHRDTLDNIPYGPFFYTQEEMKELIKYAEERNIVIVPEIEMPGHSVAGLAAYPEYSCTGGPFEPWCRWGVSGDVFCAGNDATFTFLQDILEEMFALFHNTVYIHVGGDECPKGRWQNCPKCQKRIDDEKLENENQLESWFIEKMAEWVNSKGHKLIGWDEIMEGGIPEKSIVMSWRSTSAGQTAARAKHEVIMADWGSLYLPRFQFPSPLDPYEYNNYLVTTKRVYSYDPRQGLEEEFQKYIIGVQTSLWSEYVWGIDDLQWKTFPRSCALAEIAWSQLDRKDWNRFVKVVTESQIPRLKAMGLNVAPLTAQPNAEWLKGEASDKWTTIQFPVHDSVNQKGNYEVIFVKNGGSGALKIKNVKLYFDQVLVGEDNHEGTADDTPVNNIYKFNIQTDSTTGGKIFINAEVKREGEDSNGHVYIYHT